MSSSTVGTIHLPSGRASSRAPLDAHDKRQARRAELRLDGELNELPAMVAERLRPRRRALDTHATPATFDVREVLLWNTEPGRKRGLRLLRAEPDRAEQCAERQRTTAPRLKEPARVHLAPSRHAWRPPRRPRRRRRP